jgi:hypothetical protein
MWEVFFTAAAERWLMGLDDADFDTIIAAADLLEEHGPALGRPTVDSIKGSRHHNMKELRAGSLRALFAFDPRRRAVVLVGGDKRGDWSAWYAHNVPIADDLYDAYLREETEG